MVVKTIFTGIGKVKAKKPPKLEKVIKSKQEAKQLLTEAQEKIQLKKEGKLDIKRPNEIVPKSVDELLIDGQGITAPTQITKKDFITRKPKVNQKKAKDFLDEERRIIEDTEPLSPKEIEGININTIKTSNDILRSIQVLARQEKLGTHKIQGWKETESIATLMNLDKNKISSLALNWRPGKPLNAAEIRAVKRLLVSQVIRTKKIAKRLVSEEGNDFLAMEFAQQQALTTAIMKTFKGAQVEAARAFNILRKTVQEEKVLSDINLTLEKLNKESLLLELGGKNQISKIAELFLKQPTVSKSLATLEKGFLSKSSDALVEVFLNNILVMAYTHIKNTGGNWIFKSMQRLERLYATKRYGGQTLDSVAEHEHVAMAFGEHLSSMAMLRALGSQLLKNVKQNWNRPLKFYKKFPGTESTIHGSKIESPPNAFSAQGFGVEGKGMYSTLVDVVGRVLTIDRLPYKWLKNVDNYFKNGAFSSEIYALAYRETIKQIKQGSLQKKDAAEYLASLVVNPPPSFTQKAYETALERTFQTPLKKRGDILGSAAAGIQKFKMAINPLTIFTSQFFTFLRTPTNIAGASMERTPGLNRILKSYRDKINGGGADAEIAKAKAAMGWAFLSTFAPLGYFGIFSGSDPDVRGRKEYAIRQAGNYQPKSFRFHNFLNSEWAEATGLTGDKLQLNLTGFEPAVLIASNAADLGVLIKYLQEDLNHLQRNEDVLNHLYNFFSGYALAIGDNIGNSTFMQGTSRLLDLINSLKMSNNAWEPALREFKKMGAGLVPYTMFLKQFNDLSQEKTDSLKWGLTNTDDFKKLNMEFMSYVLRNIPGLENNLHLDHDWLGDEVQKFGVLTSIKSHPVNEEARKIDYRPRPRKKKLSVSVSDYNMEYPIQVNVELTEEEYKILEVATGQEIKKALTILINSKEYKDETVIKFKKAMFDKTVGEAKATVSEAFKDQAIYQKIYIRAKKLALKKLRKDQFGHPFPDNKQASTGQVGAMS